MRFLKHISEHATMGRPCIEITTYAEYLAFAMLSIRTGFALSQWTNIAAGPSESLYNPN